MCRCDVFACLHMGDLVLLWSHLFMNYGVRIRSGHLCDFSPIILPISTVVRCHSAAAYSVTWHIHSGSKDHVKYKNWWLRFVVLVLYPKSTPWTSFSTLYNYSDGVIAGKAFQIPKWCCIDKFLPSVVDAVMCLWRCAVCCAVTSQPPSLFWTRLTPPWTTPTLARWPLPLTSCCKRLHSSSLHPVQAQHIKLASYLEVVCVCACM